MVRLMSRFMNLLGLAIACGCGTEDNAPPQTPALSEAVVDSSPEASAFQLDETKHVISLNTQIAPGQQRRFDIGQGSITIETLHVRDGNLTFHYTPEVEGGYATYECTVPVSPKPVEFIIDPGGTPGATSFDLTKCKLVRHGNLLLEP